MMNRKERILLVTGIIAIIILVGGYFIARSQTRKVINITNFEECATAGYPIMESYPEQCRTPDGRTFTRIIDPQITPFEQALTLGISEKAVFSDGLQITLEEINDSRCKQGVQCIWAGELSPLLRITGGNSGKSLKEIRLGTETIKSVTVNGYTFALKSATETMATITVAIEDEQTVCTQDAKMCSDGSYVSRIGPACEFEKCPIEIGNQASMKEGQREGPLLVEKIYPTYITGLVYLEYPVATNQGSPITMYIGDTVSNGCTITMTLVKIINQIATFTETSNNNQNCPI